MAFPDPLTGLCLWLAYTFPPPRPPYSMLNRAWLAFVGLGSLLKCSLVELEELASRIPKKFAGRLQSTSEVAAVSYSYW